MPEKYNMLSKLDKRIINLVSRDIPLTKEPFKDVARKLGIDESLLFERMRSFKKKGLMRKFCASLNHKKIGFQYNAMVVWNIPDKLINKAGNLMASFAQVSHCYQRKNTPEWNYNLYSMIHGRTKKECLGVVRDISQKTSPKDYRVLFSTCEYKKSAAKY